MELTPSAVEAALCRPDHADELAAQLREWFGAEALRSGPDPKIEETTAVWALEVPSASADVTVRVLADDGSFKLPLQRLGVSDLFAAAASLQSGTAFRWSYEVVDGERRTHLPPVTDEVAKRIRGRGRPFEVYATHPDSRTRDDVPHGRLETRETWRSTMYAGTTRDWWYYVPAQYDAADGACVMAFQDGQRPDAFHKVLSWVGSFTDIRGGHMYPSLIRKTPPKPIRVFLQDGKNDLDVSHGDWWLAKLTMASALEYAGYDYTTAWGNRFHSNKHGRAILPDSLRWLWRGYGR